MPYVHPAWLEHQRKRWTRENAHLWVRPDADRWLRQEARQFLPPNWGRPDDPEVKAPRGVPETRADDVDAETEALRWRSELAAIRFELALIKAAYLRRKYSPDQPRVPAGNPDGGQWTSGEGGDTGPSVISDANDENDSFITDLSAARRISRALEAECLDQYRRDTFHCTMVGSPACHAQAAERYSACLKQRPLPPLNY